MPAHKVLSLFCLTSYAPWILFFVPDRSKIGKNCQKKKNIIRLELSAHYEDGDIRIELDAGKTISEKKTVCVVLQDSIRI